MAEIDLKKYILETNNPQKFVVKIAQKVDNDLIKYMEKMLKFKGMSNMTPFEEMPFQPNPIDFPRLKNFCEAIYKSEMEFDYPMTENLLRSEISNYLDLSFAYIIVRKENSPLEEYIDDYLTIEDENYQNDLLEKKFGDITVSDWYGDDYNKELVKAQEKSSSSVTNQYEDVELEKNKEE